LKRLVYLISPNKIYKNFYLDLKEVLATKKVEFFQLRLKKISRNELIKIGIKIKYITNKHNVKFIVNDSPEIAKKIDADGCHIGQSDGKIMNAKKYLKNKIIGVTCHNSKKLALKALKNNIQYIAFGSFYKSKLKPNAKTADIKILKWAKKNIKRPIVAIGGINDKNYRKLISAGANYIAISSFIWDNPFLKPKLAIKKFKK
jgi:thiamine-phosphate pyrophosphorylase